MWCHMFIFFAFRDTIFIYLHKAVELVDSEYMALQALAQYIVNKYMYRFFRRHLFTKHVNLTPKQ